MPLALPPPGMMSRRVTGHLNAGGRGAAGRGGLTRRRLWLTLALGVPLLATAPEPPPASAALQAGAGYDYQSGPGSRTTQGALGFLVAPVRGSTLTLAAARYLDSQDEDGVSGTAAVITPLRASLGARGELSRLVGDGIYRAWRYRIGPQLGLGGGGSLFPYYLRNEDNRSTALNAFGVEVSVPVGPNLAAQGGVSYATRAGEPSGGQGMAGFLWTPVSRIQLIAQAGVGRNDFLVTRSGMGGGGGGVLGSLPILGGRGGGKSSRTQTTEENAYASALSLGFRVLIP